MYQVYYLGRACTQMGLGTGGTRRPLGHFRPYLASIARESSLVVIVTQCNVLNRCIAEERPAAERQESSPLYQSWKKCSKNAVSAYYWGWRSLPPSSSPHLSSCPMLKGRPMAPPRPTHQTAAFIPLEGTRTVLALH
jgi:hypothetical protein